MFWNNRQYGIPRLRRSANDIVRCRTVVESLEDRTAPAVVDSVNDSLDEGRRLACARAGKNEQRSALVLENSPLGGIQLGRRCRRCPRDKPIVDPAPTPVLLTRRTHRAIPPELTDTSTIRGLKPAIRGLKPAIRGGDVAPPPKTRDPRVRTSHPRVRTPASAVDTYAESGQVGPQC